MPFHFVTVAGEQGRHGSIHEADDPTGLKAEVKRSYPDGTYCASRLLDAECEPLLRYAVQGDRSRDVMRIQKHSLDALMAHLRQAGSDFADAVALASRPFQAVGRCMPDEPTMDIRERRVRCFKDDALMSVSASTLYRHCVHALEDGAARRVRAMDGYPYYFVTATGKKGRIVDLIVPASGPLAMKSALKKKRLSMRPLALQRLAPSVQEICILADDMDDIRDGSESGSLVEFTPDNFRRWISRIQDEARRIAALHPQANPPQASADVSDESDTRADESGGWQKALEGQDEHRPIRLTAAEIREMTLDLLSQGCTDHE